MDSNFSLDYLKQLVDMMNETGLTEVEMKEGESTVRLSRQQNVAAQHFVQPAPTIGLPAATGAIASETTAEPVGGNFFKAPMVGTFYASSSPEAAPYVQVGDRVKKGQTLCIIEAMKTYNQIEAEEDGVIAAVLAENAQPVEYGEPLFRLEKN